MLAALELPPSVIARVRVLAKNPRESCSSSADWECGCPNHSSENDSRVEWIPLDCTKDPIATHLYGVDAVITCLGNRQPFHDDIIAHAGTENIVSAMLSMRVSRICVLSSVGLGDDWPPLPWDAYGRILQGMFRTVCWPQFQDLSGAELCIRQKESAIDFLVARVVATEEDVAPTGRWRIQEKRSHPPPSAHVSHLDCARFLVKEAVLPSLSRRAVVIGGDPSSSDSVS